jgi:raffinose/stachyose/melibiose transport system permease protein
MTVMVERAGDTIAGPSPRLRLKRRNSELGAALAFLALPLAFYGFAVIYPALATIELSFQQWDGLGDRKWVGLANYVYLFTQDANFLHAFRNTAIWTVLFVPLSTAIGLVIATVLNADIPARTFFRVLFYLPFVLSNVAVGLIWKWMYYPDIGVLDILTTSLGLPQVGWLSEPPVALYAVVTAAIWQAAGGAMVIFLAGLQTIPAELYEAGRLDGANRLQLFTHITLPGLRESIIVAGSLATLGSFNVFDIVYATTQGGPANTTHVLATWMYFQTFVFGKFGVGAAIACILIVMVGVIAIPFVSRAARGENG